MFADLKIYSNAVANLKHAGFVNYCTLISGAKTQTALGNLHNWLTKTGTEHNESFLKDGKQMQNRCVIEADLIISELFLTPLTH